MFSVTDCLHVNKSKMFPGRQIRFHVPLVFLMINTQVFGQTTVGYEIAVAKNNCHKEYSCASCNGVRICSQSDDGWKEKIVFSCNASTPYCDYATGTCSTQPSLQCAPKDDFICMRDGTFPDPYDCRKYQVCVNSTAYLHNCDTHNYTYDSNVETCANGSRCYTFSCAGKNGVKVAYGRDASIFAYCVNESAYIVDRCPHKYELSSSKQTCEPKCDSERLLPDVDDCTTYYKCTKDSYKPYTLTHEACPRGSGFDPVYSVCVPLSWIPECKN